MDPRTTTTSSHGRGGNEGSLLSTHRVCEAHFDERHLQHIACSDPAQLIARAGNWSWGLTLLEHGEFHANGVIAPLGAALVARIRFNRALLHRLEAPRGCTSIVLFSGSAVFVEGHPVVAREGVLILRSGAVVEIVSRAECIVSAVSVSESEWCRTVLPANYEATVLRNGVELLTCHADSLRALMGGIDSVLDAFTARPDSLHCPVTPPSLADRVLALLAGLHPLRRQRGAGQVKGARRRIGVERAREYILSHLADPIRLADLCHHTHLQARSLEYGFREIVGLSPVSYVKMLRLGEAHRRLQSRAWSWLSISEVALDSGFCHLSQFAADYKKLFMESPSATRQRCLAAKSCAEVRPRTGALTLRTLDAATHALARETHAALLRFARTPSTSLMYPST
jgi:AraC family ethanolamine operon transcriptional activator